MSVDEVRIFVKIFLLLLKIIYYYNYCLCSLDSEAGHLVYNLLTLHLDTKGEQRIAASNY